MRKPDAPTGDQDLPFSQARRQLHRVAEDLEDLQLRMQGILGTLSAAADPGSANAMELEEMDAEAEIHAVVRCVVADCIGPAIRDLRDVLIETETAEDPKP